MIQQLRESTADPRDRYYTPAWPTLLLLEVLASSEMLAEDHTIGEPCAGRGDITAAIRDKGYRCKQGDVAPPPEHRCKTDHPPPQCDLMRQQGLCWSGVDWLITNPPYTDAAEYVRRMLEIAEPEKTGCGVATLHPLPWVEPCDDRADLVARDDLSVIVLPRIDFAGPHVDNDSPGYPSCFCWLVWHPDTFGVKVMTKRNRDRAKGQTELFS